MTLALPSSPHWAPTTTVTGIGTLPGRLRTGSTERGSSLGARPCRCFRAAAGFAPGRPAGRRSNATEPSDGSTVRFGAVSGVMRRMGWATMDETARAALCARGLADIFDPALRGSIASLIEDVRDRGDAAVCDALARF